MILFTTTSAKENFFDRPKVMAAVDNLERRALSKIGGRIRLTAMRSMRRPSKKSKDSASAPGQPPARRVAMGEGLSRIYFTYDERKHSVIIGPTFRGKTSYGSTTVPQLHEFGGRVQIVEVDFNTSPNGWVGRGGPKWTAVNPKMLQKFKGRPTRTRSANFPARPFMFPALEKNRQFITDSWSGATASVGE